MRRITTTISIIVFIFCSIQSDGQEICKWLEEDAEWFYTPWSMTTIPELVKVEVVDETIIGDRRCSVLGVIREGNLIEESRLTVFYDRNIEQVFFFENEEWKLILDFSNEIEVGDVIEYYLPQNFKYYDISSTSGEFQPTNDAYKVEVVGLENIEYNGESISSVMTIPVSDNESDCFYIGTILKGIGSEIGLFGHNCTQLTAGFVEYLRCFQSSGFSYNAEEECIPANKIYFGHPGTEWAHCLLLELGDPYTVDIHNHVSANYVEEGVQYSWINGSFIAHTVNSGIDSVLVINEGEQVYYSFGGERHLLYDFDVMSGDTLFLRFPVELEPTWFEENPGVSTTYRLAIDSVGYVVIDEIPLKRIYFRELWEVDPETSNHVWAPTDLGRYYTERFGFESFIFPYIVTGYDENNIHCDLNEYADPSVTFKNEEAKCIMLSVEDDILNPAVTIVPNPSSATIQVAATDFEVEYVSIFDLQGQLVMRSQSSLIDISSLNNGLYIVKVRDRMGKGSSVKLVKGQ